MILYLPFRKQKSMAAGLLLLLILVFMAIFSPLLSPYDPVKVDLHNNILPPSREHPFGTDNLGRDVFSRVMYGTRMDILAGLFIVGVSVVTGLLVGIVAGYRGGILDKILVGAMDTFLALPDIILALVIVGAMGPGIFNTVLALSLLGWVRYARIARSSTLSLKEKEFIETTKASGAGDLYVIMRHVLPNVIAPISTLATLHFGHAILSLAGLGFLGLGAQPPVPEWGAMLNEGRVFLREAWWLSIFPGLAIMVTVLSCNLLSDGLRDFLDPRLRRRVVAL
ncbi:ABC transporter permease [Desulfofundulus sp. TPOSR]|uniref:nickel transporter permease n=1 Tax=Desulfofundulus sp. TPOSR TaxID=2714340 RepID=UPI001407C01A|nr:nickel transporter permease [Desulfofundulus sp. TPOSR]NHM26590.1 ABC transporter permease [Desulfofundulus sp. TPOSR]